MNAIVNLIKIFFPTYTVYKENDDYIFVNSNETNLKSSVLIKLSKWFSYQVISINNTIHLQIKKPRSNDTNSKSIRRY